MPFKMIVLLSKGRCKLLLFLIKIVGEYAIIIFSINIKINLVLIALLANLFFLFTAIKIYYSRYDRLILKCNSLVISRILEFEALPSLTIIIASINTRIIIKISSFLLLKGWLVRGVLKE